nr:type IV pilus twitching motility protein PilT [Plesiomonas shigelloides]
MDITELLAFSVKHNASDLHLSAGNPPLIRVDGEVRRVNMPVLDGREVRRLVYDIMNDVQRRDFETEMELDFSFELNGVGRFRVNAYQQQRGISAALRTIPTDIPTLEQLNAPEVFRNIATQPRGLVLVTGPTGSGKSTTLAAMLNYVNQHMHHHILTIEDPIEFIHTSNKCLINQREVHRHTHSFNNALRSALREDPDVILVGELRDLETIRLALTAAETGHLVFGTLHTSSAAKTIDRIVDVFPGAEKDMVRSMLSESLKAVISQVLLRKEGGGRVAAHEIMLGTPAIRNLIREDKIHQIYSILQTSSRQGMQTLEQALNVLTSQGVVSYEEAQRKMNSLMDGGIQNGNTAGGTGAGAMGYGFAG